jgi:D-alanine-D-alanine ligase
VRICVLQSAFTTPYDNFAWDPSPWLSGHTCEHHYIAKASAAEQVSELAHSGAYDLFINFCDGCDGDDEAGIEVVLTLERLGLPFTGADSRFYGQTREAMKLAAHACGVCTPDYVFATDGGAAELAADTLRFPLLVKHANSYSSIGMTPTSRVTTRTELRREVMRFVDDFGGALIEEFIEGREFTVLVAENPEDPGAPIAFTPLEILFPPGETFKHFQLKWIDYTQMKQRPVEDLALAARLKAMSQAMFIALDGCSYGRCDLRMRPDGELHMLEINSNCGIFHPPEHSSCADFILRHDPRGPGGFLDLVFASAMQRWRRGRPGEAGALTTLAAVARHRS